MELKPRFIIMFEPNLDFVRRIEVYRASNPGLAVRLYLEMWETSVEEDMYLAEVTREKAAFEQLIRERSVSPYLLYITIMVSNDYNIRVWCWYCKKNLVHPKHEPMQ
jgi:hypothetical protein